MERTGARALREVGRVDGHFEEIREAHSIQCSSITGCREGIGLESELLEVEVSI